MLELLSVDTFYGERQALYGISMNAPDGSAVAMLGRNGMGKTTIIRTIMGLSPSRRGEILFNKENIDSLLPNQIALKGIGLVPQGRAIFPSLSVKENTTIAARNCVRDDAWNLDRIYELFPILKPRANLYGNLLSGGEQQMLAIARALMSNPDMLLMDEPSEGLAPIMVREVSRVIKQIRGSHSVLIAEQNINMALEIADYVYIISNGMVVHEADPQEIKDNMDVKMKYLGV